MDSLYVRRVSRWKHLWRHVAGYAVRRLGKTARRGNLPRLAVIAHDQIGDAVVIDGRYETDVLDAILEWLLPRAVPDHRTVVALDVGANIGNHALAFAPLFAKVLAFEPNPIALHLLRANVALNAVSNIEIYACGLGDTDGEYPYATVPDNLGGGRFLSGRALSSNGPIFDVRNGDALLSRREEGQRIGLVKVDVEGMEASVFQGLSKTLQEHRPVVLFEALTPEACVTNTNALRALGYTHFFAVERRDSYLPFAPLRMAIRLIRGADVLVMPLVPSTQGAHGMLVATVGAGWISRRELNCARHATPEQ